MNNIERLNEKKITITKDVPYLSNHLNVSEQDDTNTIILKDIVLADNPKTIYNDMKKYRIIEEETFKSLDSTLYRIQALKDFSDVKKGDKGGWVESEKNLSQEGDCWIYDNAKVFNHAKVYENAQIRNKSTVYNSAKVHGNVKVFGYASISKYSEVYEDVRIYDNVIIEDFAKVHGKAILKEKARIRDNAEVCGNAFITDNATIMRNATIDEDSHIFGNALITDYARIYGKAMIGGDTKILDKVNVFNYTDTYLVLKYDDCIRWDAVVKNVNDIITLRNELDPKRILTYTKSNKMWNEHISTDSLPINEFYGTSDELIKYGADKNVRMAELFETYVTLVKQVEYITSMR